VLSVFAACLLVGCVNCAFFSELDDYNVLGYRLISDELISPENHFAFECSKIIPNTFQMKEGQKILKELLRTMKDVLYLKDIGTRGEGADMHIVITFITYNNAFAPLQEPEWKEKISQSINKIRTNTLQCKILLEIEHRKLFESGPAEVSEFGSEGGQNVNLIPFFGYFAQKLEENGLTMHVSAVIPYDLSFFCDLPALILNLADNATLTSHLDINMQAEYEILYDVNLGRFYQADPALSLPPNSRYVEVQGVQYILFRERSSPSAIVSSNFFMGVFKDGKLDE